ncbi:MAG: Maf family nucleotide pyrophosphatase [Dehalococcoidia bacterium]|nr:Maf family nucleotide pyrophosphatase [Dehalococcoidia bacterium]
MNTNILEVGSTAEVDITGMTPEGDGITFWDGQEVHIFGALPGERVRTEIVRRRRNYWFGQTVEILEASGIRGKPACPYYGTCTGCQWQHIAYERQLDLKTDHVREVVRGAGLDEAVVKSTLPAEVPWNYRNHARFTIRRDGSVGFVHRETRRFVQVGSCLIMHPWINGTLAALQGRCVGMTQMSVRYGVNTGSWLIQPRLVIPGLELESGQRFYVERFQGHPLRVSSPSFFQVNIPQADKLMAAVLRYLAPDGEQTVVDAYAGVGTFAVALSGHVRKVVAIEESASAILDARSNIEGLSNVELVQSKVEGALSSFPSAPDAVILDPPRAGCVPEVLEALGRYAPEKVIYVSCDPVTLARDMEILSRHGFQAVEVQPVDMFPQTHRVECVALLRRSGCSRSAPPPSILLASASPRRRELLSCLGLPFESVAPSVDEKDVLEGSGGYGEKAERSALAKASWAARNYRADIVMAGDTLVVAGESILGKPRHEAEAKAMLRRLRGKAHDVVSGVAVVKANGDEFTGHAVTEVKMRWYSDEDIEAYVASGDCLDKAGAYGVQSVKFSPAESLRGCYLNVVGFPLCILADLLAKAEVNLPDVVRLPDSCRGCAERTLTSA